MSKTISSIYYINYKFKDMVLEKTSEEKTLFYQEQN